MLISLTFMPNAHPGPGIGMSIMTAEFHAIQLLIFRTPYRASDIRGPVCSSIAPPATAVLTDDKLLGICIQIACLSLR